MIKKLILVVLLMVFGLVTMAQNQVYDADYFNMKIEKANKQKHTGQVLITAGLVTGIVGAGVVIYNSRISMNGTYNIHLLGTGLFLCGGLLTNIGIPIYLVGSISADTYRKSVLKELKVSTHGLGLKLTLSL
jgi:hypothetical protein